MSDSILYAIYSTNIDDIRLMGLAYLKNEPAAVKHISRHIKKTGQAAYYIDADQLNRNCQQFITCWKTYFERGEIFASLKTNSIPYVIKSFNQLGIGAEAVSWHEINKARNCGFQSEKIIFSGPGKNETDISNAIRNNIRLQLDSMEELYVLEKKKTKVQYAIRIRHESIHGPSRFGIQSKVALEFIRHCKNTRLRCNGLHIHQGSSLNDIDLYNANLKRIVRHFSSYIRQTLDETGLFYLNIGGGFMPADSQNSSSLHLSTYFSIVADILSRYKIADGLVLQCEPGRYLSQTAGYLAAIVGSIKPGKNKTYVQLDIGKDALRSVHQYLHPLWVTRKKKSRVYSAKSALVGNNCFERDIIYPAINLPSDPEIIIVGHTGAYDCCQVNSWTQLPIPVNVMHNGIMIPANRLST